MAAAAVVGSMDEGGTDDGIQTQTYDRVVRIVSWVFLLATTTIVAVSGLWPENEPAILMLMVLAGVFVLVVHDLLPSDALGPAKFALEGSVAITVATMLVALTGGVASPFFFTFPLIVGGAALVVSPPITITLATIATLGYLLAVVLGSPDAVTSATTIAVVGVNLTAMILLAYVAMVIAREQRRSRDAAIRLSTIDPLTGLFNRGFFFAALEREIARSARSGRGFCLLMMDLDELKAINDRLGHFYGDKVLRAVGEVVTIGVRRIDTAARYGGDEYVVLLPETDPTGAFVLAEKIRIGVARDGTRSPRGGATPVALDRRGQLPRRRLHGRRADDQRGRRDVSLQAWRQEPGHGRPDGPRGPEPGAQPERPDRPLRAAPGPAPVSGVASARA